ncbi:MAG: PEP/pyruvate-binding domain-containing protein [Bacteroidota bacterium]|nr:PEP/pyruvate-binding domain-containing protein [Bacteroidota bacterium]
MIKIYNNIFKYLIAIFIVLFLSTTFSYSQSSVHGVVSDVLTENLLSNVKVSLLNKNSFTKSNDEGYFYLPYFTFESDSSNSLKGVFMSRENYLSWHFNTSFNFMIINVSGQVMYQQNNVTQEGELSIVNLPKGIYYIKLISPLGNNTYTFISYANNQNISIHKKDDKNFFFPLGFDTLFFSKEDYYNIKVPLQTPISSVNSTQNIKMLRKHYKDLYYFNILHSKPAFDMISSTPPKTHLGGVESVKIFVNSNDDLVYYMNTKIYKSHYNFATQQLNYSDNKNTFNFYQYQNTSQRYLFPITINYFRELDIYTFEFFSGDGADCSDVAFCYEKIINSSYLKGKLYFYSTNNSWVNCNNIPTITANELFKGQNYQALNLAENYGYLQKIDIKEIGNTNLQRHDILLTNGIPIDISVIAGIITTQFQPPLSHINVLSHNRGTPNMAIKNGFTNPLFDSLLNKLIYFQVLNDSFILRCATLAEANAFWNANEPTDSVFLDKDVSNYGLIDLNKSSINDVNKIGGKAANFAELLNAFKDTIYNATVPEGYFAIPFYFYENHLISNGLDSYISNMLNNSNFMNNSAIRKSMLKKLQDSIISLPINQDLLDSVLLHLHQDNRFTSYRFRSSTNAEDLEGFNGAGLYSSYTGKLNNPTESVEKAIKKVWASLWNFTAFEEREYFKINHQSCAMGILVHRSFPDEDANGVVITKNPYNSNHAYIVNVQFGEISIVNPEPGIINDQVVIYTFSFSGKEPYTLEYNSYSNVHAYDNKHVMEDKELYQLGDYLGIIKSYFFDNVYNCTCPYKDFGLDIEFKLDSEISTRKLYIKQVRPY